MAAFPVALIATQSEANQSSVESGNNRLAALK
jgi:hypothetical protein